MGPSRGNKISKPNIKPPRQQGNIKDLISKWNHVLSLNQGDLNNTVTLATTSIDSVSDSFGQNSSEIFDTEIFECMICKNDFLTSQKSIQCDKCHKWSHINCLFMLEDEYDHIFNSGSKWFCAVCNQIKDNKIKWGSIEGEEKIKDMVDSIYKKILDWKKNIFLLPRGKSGSDFLKELTRLLNLFNNRSKWQRLALPLLHIFIPIMLQKPSKKSKPKNNAKFLQGRLDYWAKGDFKSLMNEMNEIQKRIKKVNLKNKENDEKAFVRFMMFGKIKEAARFIKSNDNINGVHCLNENIMGILEQKHPNGKEICNEVKLIHTKDECQPVIFEDINSSLVQNIAKNLTGSGGPTLVDASIWKDFLCSKAFGADSINFSNAIAEFTKRLCTEEIDPVCLTEFTACRLIPFDKGLTKDGDPGVRPIGIGEVFHRLTGKILLKVIREDVMDSAGPLQTCSGLKSGIEAAIHGIRKCFEDNESEGMLKVDAENAFNNMNRKLVLHNIKESCPPFHRYLKNTYQQCPKLVLKDDLSHKVLLSKEGCTQGDVVAMAMYALGMKPLIDDLSNTIDKDLLKQVWFADDSSAAGKLQELRKWWDTLCIKGPKYGYYPLASKTILLVKHGMLDKASQIFENSGVEIREDGVVNMGSVIGNEEFKKSFVSENVKNWVLELEFLSKIARSEPQIALSFFNRSFCHRWTYLQRTTPNIGHLFQPLEDAIHETFIPALIGRTVSDIERRILALPIRYGGINLRNPVNTAISEFTNSLSVSESLTNIIYKQDADLSNYDHVEVMKKIKQIQKFKDEAILEEFNNIINVVDSKLKRALQLSREKGAGSWLSVLPNKSLGFDLNMQEFRDAICLRYNWNIPNTPSYCYCGAKNDVNHLLICKKGGYVSMRHNYVRDLEVELLNIVAKDVKKEPVLLPLCSDNINTGNIAANARLDVSAVGVWSPYEKTYVDVRVFHPNAKSYADKNIGQLYKIHENEKKRAYNERVLQIEKGSFTPLIFSTTGGMSDETLKFHNRLALLIANKQNENYSDVTNFIRTRLRFSILKSCLIALRGVRNKENRNYCPIDSLSFNLIDHGI